MSDALIGFSGFVGGAILRHRPFDAMFRSTNIDTIRGRTFELVVCCGASAEKWKANRDPDNDRDRLATLVNALRETDARRFVLISTVDVYPRPVGVDEATPIDPSCNHAYGRHRFELEMFCRSRFATTVVRLPALYGRGLKKNAIFDLLHDRPLDGIPGNARFQFYDVERTWPDVQLIVESGLSTVNITAEPVSLSDVATRVFGRDLPTPWSDDAAAYDVRSMYAGLVGGFNGYWFDAPAVMAGLRRFVDVTRRA